MSFKRIGLVLILLIVLSSASFGIVLTDNNISVNTSSNAGLGNSSVLFQSFRLDFTGSINEILIPISYYSGTAGEINLRIETNNNGEPSGTLADSGCDVNHSSFTTPLHPNYSWIKFDLNNCDLVSDTNYFIVLNSGESSNNDSYLWYLLNNNYGESWGSRRDYSNDGGETWSETANGNHGFVIKGVSSNISETSFSNSFSSWENATNVYYLNNNLNDSKGSSNLGSSGTIKWGNGLFNSNNIVPNNGEFSVSTSSSTIKQADENWSISYWIYPYYTTGSGPKIIMQNAGATGELDIENYFKSGKMYLYVNTYGAGGTEYEVGDISFDKWHLITITYDSDDFNASIFIDGDYNGSGTASGTPSDSTQDYYFGNSSSPNSTNQFKGKIEDIIIFNKRLSEDEVETLYEEYTNRVTYTSFFNIHIKDNPFELIKDSNYLITFDVNSNQDNPTTDIYYSTLKGGKENLIKSNFNLSENFYAGFSDLNTVGDTDYSGNMEASFNWDGNLWLGQWSGKVITRDIYGNWTSLEDEPGVIKAFEEYDGNLIIAIDTGKLQTYTPQNGFNTLHLFSSANSALEVYDNNLFVGLYNGEVWSFDGSTWSNTGDLGDRVYSLTSFNGKLYATMQNGDVKEYNGSSWTTISSFGSTIRRSKVFNNKLWIGDDVGVVRSYDGSSWTNYGDKGNSIRSIGTFDGNIWFGFTGGQIQAFNETTWTNFGDKGTTPYSMTTYKGRLYFGKENGEIQYFSSKELQNCLGGFGAFDEKLHCHYNWNIPLSVQTGNYYIDLDSNSSDDSYYIRSPIEVTEVKLNNLTNGKGIVGNQYPITLNLLTDYNGSTTVKLYYSSTKQGYENLIATLDNQSTDTNWSYIWTIPNSITNGEYYIDVNAFYNQYDSNNSSDENYVLGNIPQNTTLTWIPSSIRSKQQIKFTFNADSNPNVNTIKVNFGDGNTSYYDVNQQLPFDFNHAYDLAGQYNVSVESSADYDFNTTDTSQVNVYGTLYLYIKDENTLAPLQPNTLTFDGTSYASQVDENGFIAINLIGISSGTHTIVAEATNKHERTYVYDLNQYGDFNYTLALLDTNKTTTFDFKYYKPDLSVCSNCWISHIINGYMYAGRQQTNSDGEITFYLNAEDNNYYATVKTDDNEWIYSMTRVHSLKPKDEETLQTLTPYSLEVGGLAQQKYSGVTTDLNVFIQSNTQDYYTLTYDYNSDYLSRRYSVKTKGQTAFREIQPYLVQQQYYTIFEVRNSYDNKTVEGIRIIIKKYISGQGETTVEEVTTDSAGIATTALILNDSYNLYFYYNGEQVYSANITPVQNIYYVYLNLESAGEHETRDSVSYHFYPEIASISSKYSTFDLNEVVTSAQGKLVSVHVSIDQNGSNKFDGNATIGSENCTAYSCNFHQEMITSNFDTNALFTVTLTFTTQNTTYQYKKDYYLYYSGSIIETMRTVKRDILGDFGALLLAILIIIAVVGAFAISLRVNPSALLIPTGILVALFVVVEWIDWKFASLAVLFGLIVYVYTRRNS